MRAMLLTLIGLVAAVPAAAEAADLVLTPASGQMVDAVINGVSLKLRVELDHTEGVTLNPMPPPAQA